MGAAGGASVRSGRAAGSRATREPQSDLGRWDVGARRRAVRDLYAACALGAGTFVRRFWDAAPPVRALLRGAEPGGSAR